MMDNSEKNDEFDFHVNQSDSPSVSFYIEHFGAYKKALDDVKKVIKSEGFNETRFFNEFYEEKRRALLYRKTGDGYNPLITHWLSLVKQLASVYCASFPIPEFKGLSKEFLKETAQMSSDINNLSKIERHLLDKGILFILEPSIPGLKLDGAVFLIKDKAAVIAMSLRHNRLDNFWFTLMHELAHLKLHSDILSDPIIENLDEEPDSEVEIEANMYGGDTLISRQDWRSSSLHYHVNDKKILYEFAAKVGVHPAIVAGRYRKEYNNYKVFNEIVNSFDVRGYFGL